MHIQHLGIQGHITYGSISQCLLSAAERILQLRDQNKKVQKVYKVLI